MNEYRLKVIGHVYFIILMIMAGVFYQERLLNFDSANYVYNVIHFKDYHIVHNRYVSYLTQWVPLLGLQLGLSLKAILISYSVALIGLIYLIYIIIQHVFRNTPAALLLVVVFGAMYRWKFYAGISEIIPSIAFGIMFIAVFTNRNQSASGDLKAYDRILYPLCGVLMALSHPVPVLPVLMTFFCYHIYHKTVFKIKVWYRLALFVLPVFIKYLSIKSGSYEANKLQFLDTLGAYLSAPDSYYVSQIMMNYVVNEHYLVWLIFICTIIGLILIKKYLSALALFASAVVIILLNLVTFHYLNNDCYIMIDGYMIYVAIVLCFFFCIEFIPKYWSKPWLIPIFVLFLGFNIWRLHSSSEFFTQRLTYLENTMSNYKSEENNIRFYSGFYHDWDKLWYPYQIPWETLLQSNLKGRDKTSMLIPDYEECYNAENGNRLDYKEKQKYFPYLKYVKPEPNSDTYFYISDNIIVDRSIQPDWTSDKRFQEINNWITNKYRNRKTLIDHPNAHLPHFTK